MVVGAEGEQTVAELLRRYEILRDRRKGKEGCRERRWEAGRGYTAGRHLVKHTVSCRRRQWVRINESGMYMRTFLMVEARVEYGFYCARRH